MNCQEISQLMSLSLDAALTADEARLLQTHIGDCPSCQAKWITMKRISQLFSDAPLVPPPGGFAARVSQRLARQEARRRWLLGGMILFMSITFLAVLVLPTIIGACMVLGRLSTYSLLLNYGLQLLLEFISICRPLVKAIWLAMTALFSPSGRPILTFYSLAVFALTALWVYLVNSQQRGYRQVRLVNG